MPRGSSELGLSQPLRKILLDFDQIETVALTLSQEQNEQSGSRGEANFVWRCKNCKREHSANIMDAPKVYPQQDPAKAMNVITIDCRGLEFVEFRADGDWKAVGLESGTKFAAIDLTDGEWFDYDEKPGEEVSIVNVKWEIRRA
ncbi:hypothetical protein LTR09_006834 [Extremus antarcticus]|uniref:Uncharacterized protein n=1 Tax=Extremus antarcticus TaxID=702011 RepID=A0AAJ0DDK5_9PEZI|nr:hypothetical protein LTR09_006834 [Extremus antarcticus]